MECRMSPQVKSAFLTPKGKEIFCRLRLPLILESIDADGVRSMKPIIINRQSSIVRIHGFSKCCLQVRANDASPKSGDHFG